jgi:predicted DNA-binding transcriptional regulator YafY
MRADRLLSILLLLQTHGQLTSRELAKRLEVSERTIHRDMEALCIAGVPVVSERGAAGGWGLVEEYRTNLTGMNPAEVQALALTPNRVLADLGLDKASDAAFIKLLAALPSLGRRDAEYVHQRIYVDMTGWRQHNEPVPFLQVIQDALWQDRQLTLSYKRTDGQVVERNVHPLGLVAKLNVWYLIAAVEDGESSGVRTYRISRVQQAALAEGPCARPKDFDLVAYWQQSQADFKASLPRLPASVRVAPEALTRLRYVCRNARIDIGEAASPPDAKGWLTLELHYETESEAAEALIALGASLEIVSPPSLRERVIHLAESVVAFYQAQDTAGNS